MTKQREECITVHLSSFLLSVFGFNKYFGKNQENNLSDLGHNHVLGKFMAEDHETKTWCRNDTLKSQNGVGMIHHKKFLTRRGVGMIHQKRRLM